MPTHSGLKLSLVSQKQYLTLPEIDHPETSQFTKRSPIVGKCVGTKNSPPPLAAVDSKADKLLGRQSSVSVYVPSSPGMRFWIRLEILEGLPEVTPYLYCKLLMNGRHIQSCGFPARKPAGYQIMKGLFDPSAEYNYTDETGTAFKSCGLERRAFFFSQEEKASAVDEGGVIEIQFFRAKGRQQRTQDPPEFRDQERYGLILATGGLVETPEDAKFYNWHLKDPKNKPYVIFKFYYRSWKTLMDLHIIDPDSQQHLISTTPSLMSLAGLSREDQHTLDEERFREMGLSDPPLDGLTIDIPDEDDGSVIEEDDSMVEENGSNAEETDDDEYEGATEESPELRVERYDDDYILESDVDRLEPTGSIGGSEADKEDNGGESGEGSYAGEEDAEEAYEDPDTASSEIAVDIREDLTAFLQETKALIPSNNAPKDATDSRKLSRPSTPYNHSYSSDDEESKKPSDPADYYESESDLSPKKDTPGYLNRPLPTLPFLPRKSSLRKSSVPLHHPRASLSDMSQAQSNSSSAEVSPSISVRAEKGSPSHKFSIGQLVTHSGNAKLIDTPPRNKRDSSDSRGTARSNSSAAGSLECISKLDSLIVAALTQTPPSKSHVDDSAQYLTPEEQSTIGIAISPLSPYANHNNDGTTNLFTPLPAPVFFDRRTTDPQKKAPRIPSSETELPQHSRGTTLSPISEYSTPIGTPETQNHRSTSPIDSLTSPKTQSIRERRFALVNKVPARLSIILPTVEMAFEKQSSDAEEEKRKLEAELAQEKQNDDVEQDQVSEVDVQVEGYDTSRQPRRRPKYDNLKEMPARKKEIEAEEGVLEGEWLYGTRYEDA